MAPFGASRAGLMSVAADDIPDSVVDNFEDADADPAGPYQEGESLTDYWSNDNGHGAIGRSTDNVAEGNHALEFTRSGDVSIESRWSLPGDGLPRYPEDGETIRVLMRDTADRIRPYLLAMVGDDSNPDCYAVFFRGDEDEIELRKVFNINEDDPRDDTETLDSATPSLTSGDWYWIEWELPDSDDNEHIVDVYETDDDGDGSVSRGSSVTTLSANDDDFLGQRGIGTTSGSSSNEGVVIDDILILD